MEGLASGIVNKLLHGPLVALKSAAQSTNGLVYIEAARRFYDLGRSLSGQESANVQDVQDAEGEDALTDALAPEPTEDPEQKRISRQASGL